MDLEWRLNTKIIETIWLFWAFHLVGFNNGILGPTILDLQDLVGVSMNLMTYVFFLQGVGFILGILLGCGLERYIDSRLLMGVSLLVGCSTNCALPWSHSFSYMVSMFCLQGVTKGLVDYAALSICNKLWQENNGAPFQFVVLGAGISSFVAPFIAKPFLAMKGATSKSILMAGGSQNETILCLNSTSAVEEYCGPESTSRVQLPYVIIGCLCFPPCIAFFYYYVIRKQQPLAQYDQVFQEDAKYSKPRFYLIILLFLFHIPVFGVLLAYGDLLTPFGVHSELKLAKTRMAFVTSVFWGSFLAGRASNLFFCRCLSQFCLICLNFAGLVITCGLLVTLAVRYEVALWISSAGLGMFSSPYLPMVMSWSSQYIRLTGVVITASLVASGIGEILIPFLSGHFFNIYGPNFLMYFIAGASAYEVIVFILLFCSGEILAKQNPY